MKLNIQNSKNETVGTLELNDEVFGGRVKTDLIWASVVQENAAERRGTHATKNRALVSGGGKKPYKQKGTGRPQVGSSRTPLWRKGGTVFGPQPRSYEFDMPKKVRIGALRAALAQKLNDGAVIVVDALETADGQDQGRPPRCCAGSARSGKTLRHRRASRTRSSCCRRATSPASRWCRRARVTRARHHGHRARDRHARGAREAAGDAWIASAPAASSSGSWTAGTGSWKLES